METTTRKATVRCPQCGRLNRIDMARAKDGPRCGQCRGAIPTDRPLPVTDAEFDAVVGGTDVPVVVDFYADWCGPCKMMAPTFDALARDRQGAVLVLKLDTDRSPRTAQRFRIASIPTIVTFRGGREVGRELGAIPRPRLDALVDAATRGA
jgi:thioredoxin 2